MSQEILEIPIKDLVLWTENPRDPINSNATDQDVVNNALDDKVSKWTLSKLAKEMRGYYDLSELPTVVYHGKKPVVYDGNRRMILAKIKHGLVEVDGSDKIDLPDFPKNIPCNVCSKDIAIKNVFRKHGDSGSWAPLDRDIFIHKYMHGPKSLFMKIEESTNLISSNPYLNQGFVKKEIFTLENLHELGFDFEEDEMLSRHSKKESSQILSDIASKIVLKEISTRKNRGKVFDVLDKQNRVVIEKNKTNNAKSVVVDLRKNSTKLPEKPKRQSTRSKSKPPEFFGGTLYLKQGKVSDFYRDIVDLYKYYSANKDVLSIYFPSLLRMSLRLLSEAAAEDSGMNLASYLQDNFAVAKKKLDNDAKTTLSTQNVKENSIVQLLHIGAHNYQAANNIDQTIAISIMLGSILQITHGK